MYWRAPFVALAVVTAAMVPPGQSSAQDVRLIGSGASFPFPIYSAWFKDFSKQNNDVTVDYQAKGSGAGIQDFINHTVDFAGSDAAMTDEEIAKVSDGVVLLPVTAGEIVLAYNLPGNPKELKLPHDVYPDIFLGKITKWNDPRIAAANPSLKLPDMQSTVVRRSDSSGTTFVFTKHLSAVNQAFAKEVGSGTTVQWPKGEKMVLHPRTTA
jgi:phosphate transport system substrate-binding protein